MSIVFSYPLTFVGIRDGVFDLMKVPPSSRTPSKTAKASVAILSVVTLLACVVKDLGFVLSFGGATLGNAIVFVFPAFMFAAAVEKAGRGGEMRGEVRVAKGVAWAGVGMGLVGAVQSVKAIL